MWPYPCDVRYLRTVAALGLPYFCCGLSEQAAGEKTNSSAACAAPESYLSVYLPCLGLLMLLSACRSGKPGPHMWPYPGDVRYLRAMAVLGTLCMLSVVAVEAYAIWFLIYANDIKDRDTFGILGG